MFSATQIYNRNPGKMEKRVRDRTESPALQLHQLSCYPLQ